MSYIWESYSKDKKYYLMKHISPYREAVAQNQFEVAVNPLYRFQSIFDELLEEDKIFDKNAMANAICHFLAQLDLRHGYTDIAAELDYLNDEIEVGNFGSESQKNWSKLNNNEKLIFLYYLRKKFNSTKNYFYACASKLFELSLLYYDKAADKYYMYVSSEKNDKTETLSRLLEIFFWDMTDELEWVYKYHFGIIGQELTMRVGSIQII